MEEWHFFCNRKYIVMMVRKQRGKVARAGTTGWQRASPLDNGFSATQPLPIHQVPNEREVFLKEFCQWDVETVESLGPLSSRLASSHHRCSSDGRREAQRPSGILLGILLGIPSKTSTAIHLLSQILLIIYALLSSFQGTWRGGGGERTAEDR